MLGPGNELGNVCGVKAFPVGPSDGKPKWFIRGVARPSWDAAPLGGNPPPDNVAVGT